MLLLTWHGTILRVEQSQNRLIHARLVPEEPDALDLSFDETLPGGLALYPGPYAGAFHIRRGAAILHAGAESPYPSVTEAPPTDEACVLPITEAEAAALRALLSMAHFHAQAGAEVPPASLRPGFVLAMGPDSNLDLVAGRPSLSDLGIELPRGAGTLVRADAVPRIALAAGPAAAAIVVEGGPEAHFLPFTAAFSTRNWFYGAAGAPPLTGLQQFSNIVRHAREAFVLTLGGQRTVFTRHGVVHGAVDPAAPPPYPEGVVRRGDQFFVAEAVVDAAPVLAGPHVLLPPGGEHPIMRAVLPLVLLAPHLPPRTALMGPAPAADLLGLFGFAKLRRVPAAVSLCGAETLFWSEAGEQLSADVARAARDRAHAVQPPPLERRRIFVTAGLGNAAWLSEMTTALGFETVHAMPADAVERARLFASARSLIAVSGLALENVLFCLPGTQIVELSPDVAWDGRYAVLSDQLGLLHAVQPCAVADGALVADGSVLRLLLRLLQARP